MLLLLATGRTLQTSLHLDHIHIILQVSQECDVHSLIPSSISEATDCPPQQSFSPETRLAHAIGPSDAFRAFWVFPLSVFYRISASHGLSYANQAGWPGAASRTYKNPNLRGGRESFAKLLEQHLVYSVFFEYYGPYPEGLSGQTFGRLLQRDTVGVAQQLHQPDELRYPNCK